MRKPLFVFLIVLLAVAWAAAQQNPQMPSSGPSSNSPGGRAVGPADSGQSTSPAAPSDKDATSPKAPSSSTGQAAVGDSKVVEGCLGGTAPDFTVTDKAGTVYKLDIPKDADTSGLKAHIGESVMVKGVVSGEKATASASPAGASASTSPMIQVEQMARGTSTCPAGAGATPPSAK